MEPDSKRERPQHVNPGLDCTINPIVIDDSKRSKRNCPGKWPWACVDCPEYLKKSCSDKAPTTPSSQQEYIITEEQLAEIMQETSDGFGYSCVQHVAKAIRSRPSPAPTEKPKPVAYPLTDEDIEKLADYANAEDAEACIRHICDEIKRRSTDNAFGYANICNQKKCVEQRAKLDAAIVAATLDKLVAWRKEKELKGECPEDCIKDWLEEDIFILSLRTPSAPEQENPRK